MFRDISIRTKLLILLLGFSVLVLLLIVNFYQGRKDNINALSDKLTELEIDVHKAIQAQDDFIIHEPINPDFFETGKSRYFELNDSLFNEVSSKLQTLSKSDLIIDYDFSVDTPIFRTGFS